MLGYDVDDLLPKAIALADLNTLLHMAYDDESAHGGREPVVLVRGSELVFHKVLRVHEFAAIVVEGRNLAHEAVRANGLGTCLNHVRHHQGVVVGTGDGHHDFLHEGLFEVYVFHELEARGIAEQCLKHRREREEEDEHHDSVDTHGCHKHGQGAQGLCFHQDYAADEQYFPEDDGEDVPHRILTAHRIAHKPGGQHGAQKVEERHVEGKLKGQGSKDGEQEPKGHVAPCREDGRNKAHCACHREGYAEGVREGGRCRKLSQGMDTLGAKGCQKRDYGHERQILGADD